jgi:hypothetical protein
VLIELRQPLSISASGDRSTLYRTGDDGRIYNDYTMRISNRSLVDGAFTLKCSDAENNNCMLHLPNNPISLKSREVADLRLSISTDGKALKPGPNRFELMAINDGDANIHTKTEIVFFMPQ